MLTYFDRASMACSLEVRVPFLDHEFVELAARIPTKHKVHGPDRQARPAARRHGPRPGLRAGKKRKRGFFNEAVGTWVGADGGALVDRLLLADEPAYAAVIDRAAVARAVREWRAGAAPHEPAARARDARAVAERVPAARAVVGARRGGGLMLRYAVVTPARNEEGNLPRLGRRAGRADAPAGGVDRRRRRLDRRDAGDPGRAGRRARLDPAARAAPRPTPSALNAGRRQARDLDGFRRGVTRSPSRSTS